MSDGFYGVGFGVNRQSHQVAAQGGRNRGRVVM